ncbi:MAG: S8 family serine peptidase [Alphaproteobacteria bacterium]|nr:S8 family serine peptidase [Alphaproteobacteria bacterium]
MDFAPQAKVLPVSTYNTYGSSQFYDMEKALTELSQRSEVGIINMSSGYTNFDVIRRNVRKTNGKEEKLIKIIHPPKLIEAFKAVVKAGKVVVIGAGNEGKTIDVPQFRPSGQGDIWKELAGQLMQELDVETRQSIVVAGSYDRMTNAIASYSNKAGCLKNVQDAFLLAPGNHVTNFAKNDDLAVGTSFAAPYICAAIANLASKRNITPKKAVQALKETAERRPDVRTYGRGIIRADKALELLERQ